MCQFERTSLTCQGCPSYFMSIRIYTGRVILKRLYILGEQCGLSLFNRKRVDRMTFGCHGPLIMLIKGRGVQADILNEANQPPKLLRGQIKCRRRSEMFSKYNS